MAKLRATHFVGADTIQVVGWPRRVLMVGDIGCLGNIRISVEKYLTVLTPGATGLDVVDGDHDIEVQTQIYAYHAAVVGHGMILRYDNNHGRSGHADWHHVHRGDWRDRTDDAGKVEWIGEHRWPTLGDVIQEVADWYYEHIADLPEPDRYADPLSREPHILWNMDA
jgi:hypothetical protein